MSRTNFKGGTNRTASTAVSIADPGSTVAVTGGCESASAGNPLEDAIRLRAHSKWEAAGCPAGDGIDFWLEAERELQAMLSEPGSAPA